MYNWNTLEQETKLYPAHFMSLNHELPCQPMSDIHVGLSGIVYL